MTATAYDVEELVREAKSYDHGDHRIMLLEEAVRMADSLGPSADPVRYAARDELVESAIFGGSPEKATVAYSWCLAYSDRVSKEEAPTTMTRTSRWLLLWRYKWIVGNIYGFPQIPKKQIYEMIDDMARRFREEWDSVRPVYNQMMRVEMFWDGRAKVEEYYDKWRLTPSDTMSDCPACEAHDHVAYHNYVGDHVRALEEADRILRGRLRCRTIPHRTYARVLLPLLHLGRVEEAARHHLNGYSLISRNKDFLYDAGDHLRFLALTENFGKAVAVFQTYLPMALGATRLSDRFGFYLAALLLFELLGERGHENVRMRLPHDFQGHEEGGSYDVVKMRSWLEKDLRELAKKFDERNENDYFTRKISQTIELKELASPYPIKGHREGEWS